MIAKWIREWTNRAFLLQKEPANEKEISEPFARERRQVNGGHQGPVLSGHI